MACIRKSGPQQNNQVLMTLMYWIVLDSTLIFLGALVIQNLAADEEVIC